MLSNLLENGEKYIKKCNFYIKYFDKIKYYAYFFQGWNLKHTYIFFGLSYDGRIKSFAAKISASRGSQKKIACKIK